MSETEKQVIIKLFDNIRKHPGWPQLSESFMREFEGVKAFFEATGNVALTISQLNPIVSRLSSIAPIVEDDGDNMVVTI